MSAANLERMFNCADIHDRMEGEQAYFRYRSLMVEIADRYHQPLDRVVAAFAALSPNNDYEGNLRSLVSVLAGFRDGVPCACINVSTYRHCRDRAYSYLTGRASFLERVRGLKIKNFYHNVMDPYDLRWVTIDGHMVAAYRGDDQATMKDSIVKPREYEEIAFVVKECARKRFLLPHQYQAIVWFARKRALRVRFTPQVDLFTPTDDLWQVTRDVDSLKPFQLLEVP